MTYIAAIFALCAVALYVTTNHYRTRAANLEYLLDDAQRNAAYWQQRTDALICENNTLAVDLVHSGLMAAYCRSHRQHRRDDAAGFILVTGLAREGRKMHAWKVGAP